MTSSVLRFGEFELDPEREELRLRGAPVRLHAQPLRLLLLLASNAGEIVSREEIQRHIWPPDTHVDFEQGINAAIKQVRAALGDSAEAPRFVQTVPRRGYRFVAGVEPMGPRGKGRLWPVAAASLAVALAVPAWLVWNGVAPTADPPPTRPALVVLPFQNLGPEPETEWFSDAFTEELITHLGRSFPERLAVIARTSSMRYRESDKDVKEIADELGVDYLLEGSVLSIDGQLRVTAQLIRADDRSHLWAETYDRPAEELLQLQTEVSDRISRTLAIRLLSPRPGSGNTPDPEAYEAFLRGRYLLGKQTRDDHLRARAAFERALEISPHFARAHVGLARAIQYSVLPPEGNRLARASIERALELDPDLAEAHLALALQRFYSEYDLEAARRSFERALELDPTYAEGHHAFAAYFSVSGRHEEALAAVRRSRELDPVSADVNADIGWYHYFARRYDEAIDASRSTLELEPGFFWARLCLLLSYRMADRREEAVAVARRSLEARDQLTDELRALEEDPERFMEAYWDVFLANLEAYAAEQFVAPSNLAQIQVALGRHDEAIDQLERSYELKTGWILPFLGVDPLFDAVRDEPRFRRLLGRIGVEEPNPIVASTRR